MTELSRIIGFAPVSTPDARILILGSMPGKASLQAEQYYAHPQNAFWKIMQHITKTPWNAPYNQRLQSLCEHRIALWDVVRSCTRRTSLDSDIRNATTQNFGIFFAQHPHLEYIFFNGAAAEKTFYRHNRTTPAGTSCMRLPSTSPAYAALSFAQKKSIWLHALPLYKT